jgi:hypothetical protein
MKIGDIVRKKANSELGILFRIQRSHEVDPMVCRFKIFWSQFGFNWECLDDIEVISEDR